MKIYQKKKTLYFNLFFGVLWMAYGIYRLVSTDRNIWLSYAFLLISVLYIAQFLYSFFKPVLAVEEDKIVYRDSFKTKVFQFKDITGVSRFAGDYTFITATDKFTVYKQNLDKESIEKLDAFLDQIHF